MIQKAIQTAPDLLVELSDKASFVLSDILDAPETFNIFPFMKNVSISFYNDENAFRGLLTPDGIKINTKYLQGIDGEKGLKGTLAHEMQHIIQAVEFAESNGIHGKNIESLYNDMKDAMQAVKNNQYDYDITSLKNGLDAYMKDAGEIEARNVARRISYTYDQRKHTTLQSTQNAENQIYFQTKNTNNEEAYMADNEKKSNEDLIDEAIEAMQINDGMSNAAIEVELNHQDKPDYLDEEEYDVGQIPLEVVDRTEMLYANSDKVAVREYKIRIDEGLFKELVPEQYSETSFSDDEIPAITYRQSTDSEVPDQFLISKFKHGDYDIPIIQTAVEIKDEELLRQIKFNVDDYEEERQRKETVFEYDGLTYIPVRALTDEEKSLINNRTEKEIWKNPIIQKPNNGSNYSLNDFLQKSGNSDVDMFYCIERGQFFMPIENGIINLNEEETVDKNFRNELDEFKSKNINKKIIKEHRPLEFNRENDISLMQDIISVLEEGDVFSKNNETLGDVRVKLGNPKQNGLSHIIKRRMDKMIENEGMNYQEAAKKTSAIIFLSLKNISEAPATKEINGHYAIYKNGIKTGIGTDKKGRFVVTGFDFDNTKQEATDAINAVTALYGYAPEFLGIYAQVGAVYASISESITQPYREVKQKSQDEKTIKELEPNEFEKKFSEETNRLAEELKKVKITGENYKQLSAALNTIRQLIGEENLQTAEKEKPTVEQEVALGTKEPPAKQEKETQTEPKTEEINEETKKESLNNEKLPDFALITNEGLKTYSGMVVVMLNNYDHSAILSNGKESLVIPQATLIELTAKERTEQAQKWNENTPAYEKMLKVQYNDFFEPRPNTAYNFIHNYQVYCRKEANSPMDAMKIAKEMINKMPPEELEASEKMLKSLCGKKQTINELLIDKYKQAVEMTPLNEEYMKTHNPFEIKSIVNHDEIRENGIAITNLPELVGNSKNRNLHIGDEVRNIEYQIDSAFGDKKTTVHAEKLKILSVSKDNDWIYLMDGKSSVIELPFKEFTAKYVEQQAKEIKQETKMEKKNRISMSMSY